MTRIPSINCDYVYYCRPQKLWKFEWHVDKARTKRLTKYSPSREVCERIRDRAFDCLAVGYSYAETLFEMDVTEAKCRLDSGRYSKIKKVKGGYKVHHACRTFKVKKLKTAQVLVEKLMRYYKEWGHTTGFQKVYYKTKLDFDYGEKYETQKN